MNNMRKHKDFKEVQQGETLYPEKVPGEVNAAIRARKRQRKKLENRGIVGVIADALRKGP